MSMVDDKPSDGVPVRVHALVAALVCVIATGGLASGQRPPPIRPIGPIIHVSSEPLASIAAAIRLSDGRVFVNDIVARKVVLFDSTLATARMVTDSASVTATAYGFGAGALIPFHGDTALFLDPQSSAMPVLSPAGRIARVMATPRPNNRPVAAGSLYFTPGFDAAGRLLYFLPQSMTVSRETLPPNATTTRIVDSALIVRYDFAARVYDTVATIRMPKSRQTVRTDEEGRIYSLRSLTADPLPVVDDWVVRGDGSLVIVRGRDFHVDWMDANGKWSSAPKMAFDWQHLDDGQKQVLIDSAAAANQARLDSLIAGTSSGSLGGGAAVGRGGGGGEGVPPQRPPPVFDDPKIEPNEVADYRPPFPHGATRVDAEGNLWIRTTTMVNGQPVYDLVNQRGELFDRVQLPPFRTIAGFGPGVVYMAVKDAGGVVHLEVASAARGGLGK
jgi:hypothetical protein